MKQRNLIVLISVAGLAYGAGHVGVPGPMTARADALQEAAVDAPPVDGLGAAGIPGPHHRQLDQLVGRWDSVFRMWSGPGALTMESHGVTEREWVLDGHYLRETVEVQLPMGTFRGRGYMGFNVLDGRYETTWMDNVSTAIAAATGSYNPDTRKMTFIGSERDPMTGRLVSTRGVMDLSDPDRHVYDHYATDANGREFKALQAISERR